MSSVGSLVPICRAAALARRSSATTYEQLQPLAERVAPANAADIRERQNHYRQALATPQTWEIEAQMRKAAEARG